MCDDDEPSKVCALFMKDTEAYLGYYYATKKSDFYLLEQERHDWLSANKLCGKNNYVVETCRSIKVLYDDSVLDF